VNNLPAIRLVSFLTILTVCAALERLLPRRKPVEPAGRRWLMNLGLVALGTAAIRLLPFAALEAAREAEQTGFGFLNLWQWPFSLRFSLSLLLLDLLIYWQHRLFHGPSLLWRLHSVHHSDRDLDASSGVRFHPGELLLSAGIKTAGALFLGINSSALAVFEVLLNTASVFSHSNIALPPFLDKTLRLALVTPDMHRVHHSVSSDEMNSNFGFALPWWDRLFGTYRAQPRQPHESMALGLPS